MIARFWYDRTPSAHHISLELAWHEGEPSGCLVPPDALLDQARKLGVYKVGEYLRLPFALGLGVLLAGMSGAKLTLTGDTSAWPTDWGDLCPRPDAFVDTSEDQVH